MKPYLERGRIWIVVRYQTSKSSVTKGRKRIYLQVSEECGETTTVLPTVNAAGQAGT